MLIVCLSLSSHCWFWIVWRKLRRGIFPFCETWVITSSFWRHAEPLASLVKIMQSLKTSLSLKYFMNNWCFVRLKLSLCALILAPEIVLQLWHYKCTSLMRLQQLPFTHEFWNSTWVWGCTRCTKVCFLTEQDLSLYETVFCQFNP